MHLYGARRTGSPQNSEFIEILDKKAMETFNFLRNTFIKYENFWFLDANLDSD